MLLSTFSEVRRCNALFFDRGSIFRVIVRLNSVPPGFHEILGRKLLLDLSVLLFDEFLSVDFENAFNNNEHVSRVLKLVEQKAFESNRFSLDQWNQAPHIVLWEIPEERYLTQEIYLLKYFLSLNLFQDFFEIFFVELC